MSKTPLTDHYTKRLRNLCDDEFVPIEFARKLERELAAVTEQRDRITTIARELIAMIRINVMVGRFAECTVEQIDEHLKPWIDKIAAVKGGSHE
jgi:hypothetical protein